MESKTELTSTQKDLIYSCVQLRMRLWYGDERGKTGMSCLHWMHCGLIDLWDAGIRCFPAAGSASFEFQPDDGKMSHFSFMWNGDPNAEMRRSVVPTAGAIPLPEMHCWIYLPDSGEVVDFSTGYIPTLAKAMGFEWKATLPPPYIWARPESISPRAIYTPEVDAMKLAVKMITGM